MGGLCSVLPQGLPCQGLQESAQAPGCPPITAPAKAPWNTPVRALLSTSRAQRCCVFGARSWYRGNHIPSSQGARRGGTGAEEASHPHLLLCPPRAQTPALKQLKSKSDVQYKGDFKKFMETGIQKQVYFVHKCSESHAYFLHNGVLHKLFNEKKKLCIDFFIFNI